MSARFIGARTVDDRRRRRLATEAPIIAAPPPTRTVFADRAAESLADKNPGRSERVLRRATTLIPAQPWKLWGVVVFALLCGIAVIGGGFVLDRNGSPVREVLGLHAGHASHFFSITMLVAVTQLSLLILWHRRRSRKDFHGRYRVWKWSCLVWPLFLVSATTGLHVSLSQRLVSGSTALSFVFGSSLWMMPAVILFWTTMRVVLLDMTRSSASRWLLRTAAVAATGSLGLTLFPSILPDAASLILSRSLACAWPLFVAASYLHHARYVIHVTNEVDPLKRRTEKQAGLMRTSLHELWDIMPSGGRLARGVQLRRRAAQSWRVASILVRVIGRASRGAAAGLKSAVGQRLSRAKLKSPRIRKATKPARKKVTPDAPIASGPAAPRPASSLSAEAVSRTDRPVENRPLENRPEERRETAVATPEKRRIDAPHAAGDDGEPRRKKDRRLQRTLR